MRYPYHNQIKKRIREGEYSHNEIVKNYKKTGEERMVLHFTSEPFTRPIKPERYDEYLDILNK